MIEEVGGLHQGEGDMTLKLRRAKEVEKLTIVVKVPVGSKAKLRETAKELGFLKGDEGSISAFVSDLLRQAVEEERS